MLKCKIYEIYLTFPFYGSRRISGYLEVLGRNIGSCKVRCLMREMGRGAIYPRKCILYKTEGYKVCLYLLNNVDIYRSDSVWRRNIFYIPLKNGVA